MKRLCLVSKHAWEPADVAKGTVALPQKKSEFIFWGDTARILQVCSCAWSSAEFAYFATSLPFANVSGFVQSTS